MLVISELMPKLQEIQSSHTSNPTGAILDYLAHVSLTHILPTPPPLNPRRFIVSCFATLLPRPCMAELSTFSVVRGVLGVALFVGLGRDLRARYDPAGDLELDQRPIVLREAHAEHPATAHGDGIECGWGSSRSRSRRAATDRT